MLRVQPQGLKQGGAVQKLTWEDLVCVFVRATVGATGFLWSGVTAVNTHFLSGDSELKRDREGEMQRHRKGSVIWHLAPSDQRVCDRLPTHTYTHTQTHQINIVPQSDIYSLKHNT